MKQKTQLIILGLTLALTLAFVIAGCSKTPSEEAANTVPGSTSNTESEQPASDTTETSLAEGSGEATKDAVTAPEATATIVTNKGTIKFKFYPKDAPNHVNNFIDLAEQGFYDGTKWHRVVEGFVIQGGDPNSKDDDPNNDGAGGPGYSLDAEFNSQKHLEGTVAMARSQDPNSAGSQFYICLAPQPSLDGQYTVFGQVTEGLDVVHEIVQGDLIQKVTIQK